MELLDKARRRFQRRASNQLYFAKFLIYRFSISSYFVPSNGPLTAIPVCYVCASGGYLILETRSEDEGSWSAREYLFNAREYNFRPRPRKG